MQSICGLLCGVAGNNFYRLCGRICFVPMVGFIKIVPWPPKLRTVFDLLS